VSAERLQKIISAAGLASRRQAEVWIQEGRVTVNGRIETELGVKADWPNDEVAVDGKILTRPESLYLLMYKPYGVITSLADPQGRKTVADLAAASGITARVYPVGRLDYDTEGLLLLTNDGELAQALAHPRFEVEKEYAVDVAEKPELSALRTLAAGVELSDGVTAPARIAGIVLAENGFWRIRIVIHEGRNRQVRRMMEAVGLTVQWLKRVRYAMLTLGEMAPGAVRNLRDQELAEIRSLIQNGNMNR
jgi:23S rRNA pseudouridine2605 synthase